MDTNSLQLFAVFMVALLYSSVGHGGASGYLAILSYMSVSKQSASTTALFLNILVAGMASVSYYRAKHLSLKSTWPYLVTSVPAAFIGGMLHVPNNLYEGLLAVCLLAAALRLGIPLKETVDIDPGEADAALPTNKVGLRMKLSFVSGAIIGLLSGIVGIGGGIFLSPLIVLAGWDTVKNASGTAALFIVINSIAGLVGRYLTHSLEIGSLWSFLAVAAAGGLIGSHIGANVFSQNTLKRVLAVVLGIASLKLLIA